MLWLVLAGTGFGGLGGGYHWYLTGQPHKVAVVVDASFPMRAAWARVPGVLERLAGARYTTYALETEKAAVHGFAERLALGRARPYAPRDFTRLAQRAGEGSLGEADQVYLVTNASPADLEALPGWKIIRP
jgi:hypothetical protein